MTEETKRDFFLLITFCFGDFYIVDSNDKCQGLQEGG